MATSANPQGGVGADCGAIWMWTEECVIRRVYPPYEMTCVCRPSLLRRHLFHSFDNDSPLLSTLFLILPACSHLVAQLVGVASGESSSRRCPRRETHGEANARDSHCARRRGWH